MEKVIKLTEVLRELDGRPMLSGDKEFTIKEARNTQTMYTLLR
jgi:hypothetical protein